MRGREKKTMQKLEPERYSSVAKERTLLKTKAEDKKTTPKCYSLTSFTLGPTPSEYTSYMQTLKKRKCD